MMTWFENLMEGIERTLLTKNRDRFTQNLSVFRRDINDSLKGPNVTTATSVNDMMTWFENLMEGIERTLLTKNRDRFTQNLSVFRRDINDSLKGPNVTTATSVN